MTGKTRLIGKIAEYVHVISFLFRPEGNSIGYPTGQRFNELFDHFTDSYVPNCALGIVLSREILQWLVSDANITKQELWRLQEDKSDVASKLVKSALESLMAIDPTGKKAFKVLPEPGSLSATLSHSFKDSISDLYNEFRRKEVCGFRQEKFILDLCVR
jgi:hypothetical protein